MQAAETGLTAGNGAEVGHLRRQNARLTALLDVVQAMTYQRDLDTLLELIVAQAASVVDADRCSLFIVDWLRNELWSKIAHGLGEREIRLPLGTGIAGQVALCGRPLSIDDAYADPRFNPGIDLDTGYRTQSLICVPMLRMDGKVVGVLQALNKTQGGAFDAMDESILLALGAHAAAAIENALHVGEVHNLLDGVVKASVVAIESRDPSTCGHSERVARLSLRLAEEVNLTNGGPLAGIHFDDRELRELHYAALLHDFGKVGVREHLLVKADKLLPHELAAIRSRFSLIRACLQRDAAEHKLVLARKGGDEAAVRQVDEQCDRQIRELDAAMDLVESCNRPGILDDEQRDELLRLAARTYADPVGAPIACLRPQEVELLAIPRGSLSAEERREIESHVSHTFRFLSRIPWSHDLQRVPEYAHAHHEKMDGTGYPRGLSGEQISLASRIICVTDIYDALTAADRPYKRAAPHARAVEILQWEAQDGKLDKDLVTLFVEADIASCLTE